MLNFKNEYYLLEKGRVLYPTAFKDKGSIEVYGAKVGGVTGTEDTAHVFKVPSNHYSLNAGNIDFSSYPNGIDKDFKSIKIVNVENLISLPVNFNEFKDITPENLKMSFELLGNSLKDVQKRLSEVGLYIDSNLPGEIGLPKLPIGCTWYCNQDGHITAIPISDIYEKFQQMIDNLYTIIKERLDKDYDEFMANFLKEVEKIKEQLKAEVSKYAKDQVDTHVDSVSKPEIDSYVEEKKEEIDDYVKHHKNELKGEKGDRGASITKIKFKELAPNRSNVYTVWAEENIVGDITAPIGPHGDSIKGDKGDKGDSVKGDKGDSIKSIVFNKTTDAGNVYDVLLNTGANIGQVIAPKGAKGDSVKGDKGDSVKGDKGDSVKSIVFNSTTPDGNAYDILLDTGAKIGQVVTPKGVKGDKGDKGDSIKGDKGDSIKNIVFNKTTDDGNVYDVLLNTGTNVGQFTAPRGAIGPQGPVGPIGPQGSPGAVIEGTGLYAFQVREGNLYLIYQGTKVPNFHLDENGNLIYSTEPYIPQQKKLVLNIAQKDFKNNYVGDVKLYNGNNLLTTFGNNKNESYNENDLCYNSQEGFFFIGRNQESVYIDVKELNLFDTTKKLTVEFQFSQTDIANNWSNPLFLTSMENFNYDAGDTSYRTTNGIRLEYSNMNGSLDFYPSPFSEGTDESVKSIGIVNNSKHSVIITLENTKVIVYFDYTKVGECNIREIPKINYIGLNKAHGTHRCCNMKVYGLRVWKDTVLSEQEVEYIKNNEVM